MKIFLVGLPGSGKSTIGKNLAKLLNYKLIDTDDMIIENEGSTIEEIFKNKGEDYFRKLEQKTLHAVILSDNLIVSTGGGLPCFFDNMKVINQNGVSVFLNVPVTDVAKRLWEHENQNRPLIQGKTKEQLLEYVDSKFGERLPYYKKSTLEFPGSNINAELIIEKLRKEKLI